MKSLVLLTALLSLVTLARATVTETIKKDSPFAPDGVVQLSNVNGDIDITAWDKAEISLVADKRAKNDEELKRLEIEIEVTAQPARFSVKTRYAKKSGWFGNNWNQGSVRYKLMVPAGVRLEKIDAVNSDITVTGVHGSVNLSTVNGRIEATRVTNDVRLESVNGSLRLDFDSLENVREVKLESVNGRAELTLPKGASASIKTSSVNGSSRIDQPLKLSHSGRHNLSGDIGSGGPRISIETVNGSISVREK